MKKSIIFALLLLSTFCFAVPVPGGKASIKDTPPSGSTPPTITRTPEIFKPYPTNKWFNSLIYNSSSKPSIGMYTYPQLHIFSYETTDLQRYNGCLLIGYPIITAYSGGGSINYSSDLTDPLRSQLCIIPTDSVGTPKTINTNDIKLKSFSDWACTVSNGQYETTFGQGMLFTYFDFKNNSNAMISYPNTITENSFNVYIDSNTLVTSSASFTTDKFIIEVITNSSGNSSTRYYGIFLPENTQINLNTYPSTQAVNITFSGTDRYMSVGLMTSKEDISDWYKYAYNFVLNTTANYTVSEANIKPKTDFNFTFSQKRSGTGFVSDQTLFSIMPHQYKKSLTTFNYFKNKEFVTLRGKMKVVSGNSFSTQYQFQGIIPFFKYNIDGTLKSDLQTYLSSDVNMTITQTDTYTSGKVIAKLANLLPIADNLNDKTLKDQIIAKLKNELVNWFTYSDSESNKYFSYDNSWGGLIGISQSYNSKDYNDHHFHYGYFIYASAILAMYDETFAKDYGGMVELLIKDIASVTRNDSNFPYMRNFDIYEGHSWANGMGGGEVSDYGYVYSDSIDEESSSEAMNAWSAIYLWGIATNNINHINLGINLYTTQYNATREYYLDMDSQTQDEIYPSSLLSTYGNHGSIGVLYGGRSWYWLHWNPSHGAREIKGIQVLPLTPAMMYWGYDKNYTETFYNKMTEEAPSDYYWNDIWTRLEALFNPSQALIDFNANHASENIDNGGSLTFTYHFLNFFSKYGTPVLEYTADLPTYLVTKNSIGNTYSVYNYTGSNRTVRFYNNSGTYVGSINVNAKSFASVTNLVKNTDETKLLVYPVPYKPHSGGRYDAEGITFLNVTEGTGIKIFNIAGELVFEKSVASDATFYLWDTKNNSGNKVASGVYIYYLTSKDGQKIKGKIAIER